MKLLGISGTLIGSKPLVIVQKVLNRVREIEPAMEIELLDLRQFQVDFCDGRDPSNYSEDTKKVINMVNSADFYVIATPIFQASITGALKNLFDLVPPNTFRNKVVGLAATGGTYQHYLVLENQLKPIFGYFRSFIAPSTVYAHTDHFNKQNEIIDEEVWGRVIGLADELVFMQKSLRRQG